VGTDEKKQRASNVLPGEEKKNPPGEKKVGEKNHSERKKKDSRRKNLKGDKIVDKKLKLRKPRSDNRAVGNQTVPKWEGGVKKKKQRNEKGYYVGK